MENLTEESKCFVTYFMNNRVQSRIFKNDDKLSKKLEGIESAIREGYLRTLNLLDGSVRVSATIKLSTLYTF